GGTAPAGPRGCHTPPSTPRGCLRRTADRGRMARSADTTLGDTTRQPTLTSFCKLRSPGGGPWALLGLPQFGFETTPTEKCAREVVPWPGCGGDWSSARR